MRPATSTPTQLTKRSNSRIVWSAPILLGLLLALALWLSWSPPAAQAQKPAMPPSLPQKLIPLNGIAQVAVGGSHTCALTSSGGVLCWGWNYFGQVGDGTTADRSTPTAVSSLGSGVQAIAAGGEHTCALTSSDGALCWGRNQFGQVGDGSAWRTTPVSVMVEVVFSNHLFLPSVQR